MTKMRVIAELSGNHMGRYEIICKNCGKKFKSKTAKRKFCSLSCASTYNNKLRNYGGKVRRECQYCGRTFFAWRNQVKVGRGKYCSVECANNARRGRKRPEFAKKISKIMKELWKQRKFKPKLRKKHPPPKEDLIKLYYGDGLSIKKIAEKYNCGYKTVRKWFKEYDIKIRDAMERGKIRRGTKGRPRKIPPSREILYEMYKKMTIQEIARKLQVNPHTVSKWLKEYKIPRRTRKQISMLILPRIVPKILGGLKKRPTKAEEKLCDILKEINIPIKYNTQKLMVGYKVPDFINTEKNKILEVFGAFWHDPNVNAKVPTHKTKKFVISYYRSLGYDCLIIWDYELNDKEAVTKKILDWWNGKKIREEEILPIVDKDVLQKLYYEE